MLRMELLMYWVQIIFIEQNRCAMAVVSHVAMILFFKVEVPKSKCSYPFIVIESCYL